MENNKTRYRRTVKNDTIMLEFLADNNVEVHPVKPLFVTWDKVFFDVQKIYLKDYPDAQKWLMLSPSKLIDTYAILKFSIDQETVTENLLALISDDFIENTNTLIDTIKFILNPKDAVGLEYTNKLAEIRQKEINDINKKIATPPNNIKGETVIDDIVYKLNNHFQKKDNKQEFKLFKELFTKKEFVEEVVKIIEKAIDYYYKNKNIDNKFYGAFEKIIDKLKKEKK